MSESPPSPAARVVMDTLDAWIRCDIETMMRLRSDNCVSIYNVDGIGGPAGTPVCKADVGVRLAWLHKAYDWSRYDYRIKSDDGRVVDVVAQYTCYCRNTGEEATGPISMTYHVANGLIIRVEHKHDKGYRDAFVRVTNSHAPRRAAVSSQLAAWLNVGGDPRHAVVLSPLVVAEAHFDAMCRGDLDEFEAWCDPAALFVDVMTREDAAPETAVGLELSLARVGRFHAAYAVEAVQVFSRNVVGDVVHLMCRCTVRHRAKDLPFTGEIRCRYTIQNGRVWQLDSTRDVPKIEAWRRLAAAYEPR